MRRPAMKTDAYLYVVGAVSTIGLVCLLTLASLTPPYSSPSPTIVKHYRKGLMERVTEIRGLHRPAGVDGYAAVNDCSHIGGVVQLSIKNSPVESFYVVDCSAPQDLQRHLDEHLIAEVDWETAQRHGFAWDGVNFFGDGHAYAVMGRFYTAPEWAKGH